MSIICVFGKPPLTGKFSKFCSERIHRDIKRRVLSSNFLKFIRREISISCVAYPIKSKNFAWLSMQLTLLRGSRPKSAGASRRGCTQSAPNLSKSAHCGRSYSRMRQHRQSALESDSNSRLKPSFEPNNSSTTEFELWRNTGPSGFQLQDTALKSDKIRCTYFVTNCVSLQTL